MRLAAPALLSVRGRQRPYVPHRFYLDLELLKLVALVVLGTAGLCVI
ncbi:hypothetical protein [Streptomyces rectiverticillatus]|nr:hypothetical protein [Streptomyces rectiverticillatus]